ncbi:HNH endonuclease [Microbacterium aurantiacum]|uniref:HNH endonuclease n=1 Tax=Microbacterium aurantiacum TaxID=162393 RepID=UPI003F4960B2
MSDWSMSSVATAPALVPAQANPGGVSGNEVAIALVAFFGVAVLAFIVVVVKVSRDRAIVRSASQAIIGLGELNNRYAGALADLPPIRAGFSREVDSKAAFDRFDLVAFLSGCVMEHEPWFAHEISLRDRQAVLHSRYSRELSTLGERFTGVSDDPRLKHDRFVAIEQRMFLREIIKAPLALAIVKARVGYTSPRGQNRYSREIQWDFWQLSAGFAFARQVRAQQSTAAALRQRERSLMTPKLRIDVLRRDGSRCRVCGASAVDGASLHVDHIIPVSHGGRTVPGNLQTLCMACNLGKGNRFVG